jgi:alkylation response protein AidB-like acyl-CoA dehydrogenase
VHLALVAGSIDAWGTEEQKARWLPQMATGEVLGCFGLTEPDHGSNPADLQASAVRQPDGGYVLNGNKIFITNGTIAGLTLFMARPAVRGQGRQRLPGAERQPRLRGPPVHGKLGLRSCDTAELVLRDVRVGPEALLGGEEGTGIRVALTALNDGRMSLGASCTGLAQAALDTMVAYTQQRTQFGKPVAGHQLVQALIADTAVEVDCSRLLTYRVADLKTRGRTTRWPRPRPSTTRRRRACGPPTRACRRTAATATSTSTPPGSTCATRGLPRCTKAPLRSSS